MKNLVAMMAVVCVAGAAFAGSFTITEDNSGYDRFFTGNWANTGNFANDRDNILINGDTWVATNGVHLIKAPYGASDGTAAAPGFVTPYAGAVGDTVKATYTIALPDDIEDYRPVVFSATIKGTIFRVDERRQAFRSRFAIGGTNLWDDVSYVAGDNDPLDGSIVQPGDIDMTGFVTDAFSKNGPEKNISSGPLLGIVATAGDLLTIDYRKLENNPGDISKNISAGIGNITVYAAIEGDANADQLVDASDIGALLAGFGTGTEWAEGDFNDDDLVDASDIGDILTNFTGDPGPAPAGSVIAEYDPATGQIIVSVDGVQNWYVEATDGSAVMTGDPAQNLPGQAGSLVTDNDFRVGESNFGGPFSYTDLDLGNVAVAGLVQGDLVAKWQTGFGAPEQSVEVVVIPEPASLALLGLGGLLVIRRRRAA